MFGRKLCSAVLLVVLLAGCATGLSPASDPATAEPPHEVASLPQEEQLHPKLLNRVELEFFKPAPIGRILQEISNVYLNGRITMKTPVNGTLDGKLNGTLKEVLDRLCEIAECSWRLEGEPAELFVDKKEI